MEFVFFSRLFNKVESVMSKKIVKVIGNWVCFYSIQLFLILLNYFYHSILFIYYYKSISDNQVQRLCVLGTYLDSKSMLVTLESEPVKNFSCVNVAFEKKL